MHDFCIPVSVMFNIFQIPLEWNDSPSQDCPSVLNSLVPLYKHINVHEHLERDKNTYEPIAMTVAISIEPTA